MSSLPGGVSDDSSSTVRMLALCTHIAMMEAEKKRLKADIARIDETLRAAEADVIAYMRGSGMVSMGKAGLTATLKAVIRPKVEDWEAFWAHVAQTGEWDLLYRRVSQSAFTERREAGVQVPGLVGEEVIELTVRAK
jgi:uncharacterized small protein (DUF1192 family)